MARSMLTRTGPALSTPRWAGDYGSRDNLMIGGFRVDPAAFAAGDAVTVTVAAGGAVQGAVAVPVTALTGNLYAGRVLTFTGGVQVTLAADALTGDAVLTTEPLPAPLVAGNTAVWPGGGLYGRAIPSGTAFGRTYAERDAAAGFGPADAADDEVFLSYFDIDDVDHVPDVVFYRPNNVVYENFLPAFATLAAGVQTKLRSAYRCEIGEP